MQSEHRKIELQAPGDLSYLTTQIRAAARSKLDLHLPAQPSDADALAADDLRAQTETLVDAFVAQVLAGLKSNIAINGIDVVSAARGGGFGVSLGLEGEDAMEGGVAQQGESVQGVEEEEFEPFDDRLRVRLAEQVGRRDRLVAAISRHRRETAAASARRFEEAFERDAGLREGGGGALRRRRGGLMGLVGWLRWGCRGRRR
ncbi:hypothetical protein M3J09_006255 [Ascochyta lentis]